MLIFVAVKNGWVKNNIVEPYIKEKAPTFGNL